MKIHKISKENKEKIIYLIKNNLINSVIFNLPQSFIKNYFIREIINKKKYISLICKIKNKPAGMIIVKKKNTDFSLNLKIMTFIYCIPTFFLNDFKIFYKFYYVLFKRKKIKKKINYSLACEIIYICVDQKYRNKGIGTKLLKFSEKKLLKDHKFLITSSENSKEALKFYHINKFKNFGVEKRYKKKNILLYKTL